MKPLRAPATDSLTKEQLIILCAIRGGQVTLRELGEMVGIAYTTARLRLMRLREMGLVDRTVDRYGSLHLTPDGQAAISEMALIRYRHGRVEVGRVEVVR